MSTVAQELAHMRQLLEVVAPDVLAAYDAKRRPLEVWEATERLFPKDLWDAALKESDREARIKSARSHLTLHAADQGATITNFSDVEVTDPPDGDPWSRGPIVGIRATGWRCPQTVDVS